MSETNRRLDIPQSTLEQETSRFSRLVGGARSRFAAAALAAMTVFGAANNADARDVDDDESAEVADSLILSSEGEPIVSDLGIMPSYDLSTQLHPDGSGRQVFVHKLRDVPGMQIRIDPDGLDQPHPNVFVSDGTESVEVVPGTFTFIANIGSTRVGRSSGLMIEVDGAFQTVTYDFSPDSNKNSAYQVEIGGEQYMLYFDTSNDLVKIPVSDVESWTPGSPFEPEVLVADLDNNPNIVTLADGMILAQGDSSSPVRVINLATGTSTNLDLNLLRPLFADGETKSLASIYNATRNLIFRNDPSTPNAMWVQDPAAGTFQYFVLNYSLEVAPTPYSGTLVIDGTHAGRDAFPAGTQVHIEGIEGCDIDRTEVSTGADMEIALDDLPGGETTCRVRVTITPAEGDEITGSGVYTVEFTAGSPVQVVAIESNDVLVSKTVNFTAFEELVDGSEYASGAARETTMGPEDRPVTGRYQLYIPEIDHACEVNVVDGIGSVNIDVPEGRTVEVVVTDPVSGEEVGRFNFASGDSTLQVPLVYLARLEPNATVNLDFESTIGEFGPDSFVAYLQTADGTRVEGTEQIFGLTDLEDGSINFDGIFAANPENLAPITYTLVIESDGDASITTDPEGQTGYGNRLEFDGITFPVQLTPPNPHNVSEVVAAGVRDIGVEVKLDGSNLANARVYVDGQVTGYTDSFGQTNLRPTLVDVESGELNLRVLDIEIAQTDGRNPELRRDDWAEIDSQVFTVNLANTEIPPLVAQFETTVEPSDGDGEEVGTGEDAGEDTGEDTGIVDAGNDIIDDADAGTNPDTGGNDTGREDTGLPDTSRPDAGTDAIADVESDGAEAEFEDEKRKRGGCNAAPGGLPASPVGYALISLVPLLVLRRRRDGSTEEAKAFKLYDGARGDEPLAVDNGNGTFTITEVDPEDIIG